VNPRRLYRSRDRMLAGVAGGMAEYLDIDPTVIRILWVIIGIASGGFALIAYVILALLMPQAPYAMAPGAWGPAPAGPASAGPGGTAPGAAAWGAPSAPPAPIGGWDAGASSGASAGAYAGTYPGAYAAPAAPSYAPARAQSRGIGFGAIVGLVLIVVGVIALADAALPGWVAGAILGPAVILTLGAALLASSLRWRRDEAPQAATAAGSSAPYAAPAASEAPAPGPEATMTPTTPWDGTDTQAVDAIGAFDADQGTRPA